jgi:hypothetical protein
MYASIYSSVGLMGDVVQVGTSCEIIRVQQQVALLGYKIGWIHADDESLLVHVTGSAIFRLNRKMNSSIVGK